MTCWLPPAETYLVKQQAKLWPVWVAEERRCIQDWLQNYFVRYYHAHVHMMGSSSTKYKPAIDIWMTIMTK